LKGALAGVTVLDLSRVLAGPYCTQLFADLGATVWKVESLMGDDTRQWGPPFASRESGYFLSVNRGKKGLAVNLKDPRGQSIVRQLALRADILVENFKAGDLKRYGLDHETLRSACPRLVYASITGFGHTGPRASEPGYDVALQGMSGIMSMTGESERPPVKVGVAWIDVLTGLHAAVGILAALHERERSGQGQHLDIALFDVALASLVNQAQSYLLTGRSPGRLGSAHPQIVPYQAFEASDGPFIVAVGNDEQFHRLCEATGLPELWAVERFRTNAGRVEARGEIVARLSQRFRQQPRAYWLEHFTTAGIPVTPVNTVGEAFADPQADARNMAWSLAHSRVGSLEQVGSPFQHLSRTPATPSTPPPLLGEHTYELLTEVLGMDSGEVAVLEQAGVIHTLDQD
jgi:crotonobetainyl-CoA:carnitine CoA-transferase CaiB-like acyl-CoA transferase